MLLSLKFYPSLSSSQHCGARWGVGVGVGGGGGYEAYAPVLLMIAIRSKQWDKPTAVQYILLEFSVTTGLELFCSVTAVRAY